MNPLIAVGCPIQNRTNTVGFYLTNIYDLNYPKEDILLVFYVNNSTDDTIFILERFQKEHKDKYYNILIFEDKNLLDGEQDHQNRYIKRNFQLFAEVRNTWIKHILPYPIDYIYSIDSDVLVQPDSLKRLIAYNKDIVSCLVWNGKIPPLSHPSLKEPFVDQYNLMKYDPKTDKYLPFPHYTKDTIPKTLFEIDLTGACYLIKRRVLDAQVRYGDNKQGEDVYFCKQAQKRGFKLFNDPTIGSYHMI